ncbi:MAG: hypothetical protein JXR68_09795, partial [Bacteroidales bacterium]|nr:hypothetical protein [Bacteroidales bacterium]
MEIIDNFSIQNLTNFFRTKLYTFKPQMDALNYLSDKFEDNFTDLYKIGEAEIDNNNELLIITAKSLNQLTSRSG